MSAPYGVTTTGFNRKPQEQIQADIEARQRATISPDLDLSTESVFGQYNGIIAREFSLLWEGLEQVHNSNDPDKAEDFLLTAVAKLTGTKRRAATYSLVAMSINVDAGKTIEAGTHFVTTEAGDVRFTPVEDFTAPSSGLHANVIFRSEFTGPVEAASGSLEVIVTPVLGWNSATNPSGASPGKNVAEDPELREQREADLARAGSSTVRAIRQAVEDVEGVEVSGVLVFENTRSYPDENGLPGHSFEVVVWDGSPAAADNEDIAQAIQDNRGDGIGSHGSLSVTLPDANGNDESVKFSRATKRNIYVTFDLETAPGFSSSAFKTAIAKAANEAFGLGKDILRTRLIAFAWAQPNVENVIEASTTLGFSASPAGTSDLNIGTREIGRFETANIVVI